MAPTKYSLGFDGGGTKTEAILLDGAGSVIGQGLGGPSNPLRAGFDVALRSLNEAAVAALAQAGAKPAHVGAVCAGLAGAGRRNVVRRVLVYLAQAYPDAVAHVTTDLEVALEAAAGAGPGVVLIAGTGSAAYGRNAAGETARAGGYGPWIGDAGSAYEIGRKAVEAVARVRDQAAPVTLLSDMIPAALKCATWDDLTERIAKNPDEVFPQLFPVVAAAAEAEDSTAREILFTAALGLGALAMIAVRRLRMQSEEFPLVKCGGVFGRTASFDVPLDSFLSSGAPRAKISRLQVSPAVGAARLAARLNATPLETVVHDVPGKS